MSFRSGLLAVFFIQFVNFEFTLKETLMKPTVEIEYCPKCGWMLRSAYMAQELLTTFVDDLYGVTLIPSEISGRYQLRIDGRIVFDRKREGRFPEIKELKQLIRDHVNPDKSLGHSDRSDSTASQAE